MPTCSLTYVLRYLVSLIIICNAQSKTMKVMRFKPYLTAHAQKHTTLVSLFFQQLCLLCGILMQGARTMLHPV